MLLKALSNLLDVVTEYSSRRVREIVSGLILLWRIDRCADVEESKEAFTDGAGRKKRLQEGQSAGINCSKGKEAWNLESTHFRMRNPRWHKHMNSDHFHFSTFEEAGKINEGEARG